MHFRIYLISTEGALRLPTTYDNQPTQQTQPNPIRPTYSSDELNRPKIDVSLPPMTSNDY